MTTQNKKSATKAPVNNEHPLQTMNAVDLVNDEVFQQNLARSILGEKASEADVKAETDRRMEVVRALDAGLKKSLGTVDFPFPMWGTERVEENGQSTLQPVLSAVASDGKPMEVYSERPTDEVRAIFACDMVVPSMLPFFKDALERRRPESTNRQQFLLGDPGAGKSFMGAGIGRSRTKEHVDVFDCGGKNMNELLFEMVLDFGAGDALPVAIDKRLKVGALQALSLGELKKLPATVVDDEGNVTKSGALSLDANGNIQSIDWNFFTKGQANAEDVDAAYQILTKVSQIEGLDKGGGNALGMNSQYGPLIRWFMEGREGTLDEYNKSKEGSDNGLQTFWQFLIGETNSCTVENPLKNKDATSGPSSFTFRREDMKAGFFVNINGNKTEDGLTTHSLNVSAYDRLSPKTIPDLTVADWQHRACQLMTGVPISTWYQILNKDGAVDRNPKEFGEWLLSIRRKKAEIEGVPVPELQVTWLQNWQSVLHSTEKLANACYAGADMTNAETLDLTGNTDLDEEVDPEYSKKEHWSLRKLKQWLEEAMPVRPQMVPANVPVHMDFKNWDKPRVLPEAEHEDPAVSFGTRLVDFFDNMVYEKSEAVGKHKLYEKLKGIMSNNGFRDVQLVEGAHSVQKSVEEDLNISVYKGGDLDKQAEAARKVFCNYLRQEDPQIVETDDEQIITLDRLKKTLQAVDRKNTAETKELFVVNRDPETLSSAPLMGARIEDEATWAADMKDADFTLSDMVSYEDFMASLALPTVSGKNIAAIWDSNIRALSDSAEAAQAAEAQAAAAQAAADVATTKAEAEKAEADADKAQTAVDAATDATKTAAEAQAAAAQARAEQAKTAADAAVAAQAANQNAQPATPDPAILESVKETLDMAENPSAQGIATTTLRVLFADADGQRDVSVHVVLNSGRNKALVVGEKLPSKLEQAFKEAGITHVDRHDPDARAKVEVALNDLMRGMPDSVKERLTDAFKYRNDVDVSNHQSLSELLVDDKTDMVYAKWLLKSKKKLSL